MKVFILGGTGLVGSAYARLMAESGLDHVVITRANYAEMAGQRCDILVNANGNSSKVLADRDPMADFDASVRSVRMSLEDFQSGKYVFLSSGDVYPDQHGPSVTREDQPLPAPGMSRYGLHKFLAEVLVRQLHPDWIVVRMGGFVGPGLKKNAIFDMVHNRPVWLHPDSELQFISTDRAARLVWQLVEIGVTGETVNLGARGTVRIGAIHTRLSSASEFVPDARRLTFELNIGKLSALIGHLPTSGDEVSCFLSSLGR